MDYKLIKLFYTANLEIIVWHKAPDPFLFHTERNIL